MGFLSTGKVKAGRIEAVYPEAGTTGNGLD